MSQHHQLRREPTQASDHVFVVLFRPLERSWFAYRATNKCQVFKRDRTPCRCSFEEVVSSERTASPVTFLETLESQLPRGSRLYILDSRDLTPNDLKGMRDALRIRQLTGFVTIKWIPEEGALELTAVEQRFEEDDSTYYWTTLVARLHENYARAYEDDRPGMSVRTSEAMERLQNEITRLQDENSALKASKDVYVQLLAHEDAAARRRAELKQLAAAAGGLHDDLRVLTAGVAALTRAYEDDVLPDLGPPVSE